jgi:uncharacterized membrane protein
MSRETGNLQSTATVGGHPITALLVQFPIVCFVGAFVTDIVYWRSMSFIWETFSVWLLTAGLVGAGLAVIVVLVDVVGNRRIRQLRSAWIPALGNALVMALSLINVLVHSRDGYTAVVPTGVILSGVVVLIMMITMITGWMGVYRHRIGVTE